MTQTRLRPPAWPHQTEALDFIRDKRGAMLAIDMGAGKTRIAIDLIEDLGCKTVLILCPLSVVDAVWPDQIKTHATLPMTVVPLGPRYAGVAAKRAKAEQGLALAQARKQPLVVVVNYESASRSPLGPWLMNTRWDLLIMDESHRIKSPTGAASLWTSKMSDRVPRKLALTGTPMPHSPLDIFAQYRAIDKRVFGSSYTNFRARYAVFENKVIPVRKTKDGRPAPADPRSPDSRKPATRTVPVVTGHQNLEELQQKFYNLAYRVTADQVLDLPPTIETYAKVHLSPKARRIYSQMAADFIADLDNGQIVTASNVLSRLLRFQQLTSGYAPDQNGNLVVVDDSKARALADIIEDLPRSEPLVVFARFVHDLRVIADTAAAQGRPCHEISGNRKELDDWNREGGVLAVQIQAGGLGLDLTKARYCVYYSIGYSLGDYLQSVARLHRPGQSGIVDYIHLVADGTIDQMIAKALDRKEDIIKLVLEQPRDIDTQTDI